MKEGRASKPSKTVSKPLRRYMLEVGHPYRKRTLSREAKAKGQQIQMPVSCRDERATGEQYKANSNSCSFGDIRLTQKTLIWEKEHIQNRNSFPKSPLPDHFEIEVLTSQICSSALVPTCPWSKQEKKKK